MPCCKPDKSIQKGPCCQKCQMPMAKVTDFGTNKDGSKNEKYCCHCFQKGEFCSASKKNCSSCGK